MLTNVCDKKIVTDFQSGKNTGTRSFSTLRIINIPHLGPATGSSILALSLAACGGNDDSPYAQADLDEIEAQRAATQNTLNTLTRENDALKDTYETLRDDNEALEDRYEDLDDLYTELTAAKDTALTVSRDNFIGSLSDDKISGIFGSNATLSSADVIIDTNPGDNDKLTLKGSAFQTILDTSLASVMVEQIDVVFDTLANATINSSGITSASALNISNVRENSAASLSLTNLADGSVVSVSDFDSVSAAADENAAVTILAAEATGAVSTTVLGEGEAVINAPKALTISTSAERGNTTAQAEAATSFNAQSTSGSITLLSDANAYSRAISTFEGNITVNTPLADRVLATTTGEGSVSVVAEGDSGITVRGGSIAVLLESSDKNNKAIIKASGTSSSTGTDDVLSVVSADNFTVKNQSADKVETITISPTESIIATFEEGAASTYTGNPNVILQGDHSVFHQAAITGSKVVLTGMDLDTDLSKANEVVELNVASIQNGGGESIVILNENAQLFLSADQTNGLEINADDDIANEYLSGTLNLILGVDQSGRLVVDKSATTADGFDRINIIAQVDQDTPFQLVSSPQTKVTLSGTNNFTVGASTAEEFDASGLTGDSTGLSGVLTASQTANLLKIYGGSGNDDLSSANTSASAVVTGGPGNDSFTISANYAGSADGGSGTDTLNISSAVDLSSATLTNFEFIDLNGNNTTLNAASLSGQSLSVRSTGGAAILSSDDIQSTTNLVNLTFLDSNVSITTNFASSKHSDLNSTSNALVSGSKANDIITGHAGNDNLTGGEGSDTIAGGAGEDTIILTEASSAVDNVLINAVVGASEDSGRKPVSGNGNDTGDDTVVGFALGTDIVKIAATGVTGFVHGTDTAIGTAGGVDDGTVGSFAASVGLVELNQTANGDWDDAGDIAVTFSSTTGTFNKANFEAALQYDLTLTNTGVTAITGDKDDTISGGNGNDTITAAAGADTITGGAGADVFLIAAAADHATGETIAGGSNADTIRFTSTTASETLTLLAGVTDTDNAITVEISDAAGANTGTTALNVNSDALVDTLALTLIGNDGDNALVGNAVGDTITGGAGADTITGGAGADTITGGAGADVFLIAAAADHATGETIAGGANADTIRFTSTTASETLTLLAGVTDTDNAITVEISDAAGANTGTTALNVNADALVDTLVVTLIGNDGNNVLVGNATADTITGGAGADTITGGAGADVFLIAAAADHATGETIAGGANADTIRFTSTSASETLTLLAGVTDTDNAITVEISDSAGANTGTTALNVNADALVDTLSVTLIGNDGGNVLVGNAIGDTINGGAGADTITGGAGADAITGGAGADVFLIAAAADHAIGETITGGANADTIRFISTTASETLTLLAGVTDADNAITVEISDSAGANTGTTALNVNADALLNTLSITLIGNDGDNVLVGNATADTITGGAGADTITGGAGADTFLFDSTTGIDIITDFSTAADVMNFARTTFALESADADLADANERVTIATAAGTDNNGAKNTANDLIIMTHTTGHTLASLVNDLDGATAAGDALIVYFDSGTSLTTLAYDNNLEDATAAVAIATFSNITAANIAASLTTADFVLI